MSGFQLQGSIRIKDDGASKTLDKIAKSTKSVRDATDSYRDANGRLRNSQGQFINDTEKMNRKLKESKSLFGSLKKSFVGGLGFSVGNAALNGVGKMARSAVDLMGDSLTKAMDFEAQMLSIEALTGATAGEMKNMSNLALFEGARTKYNAMEAGQAIEELLKAGLTPATVEAGALGAALDLATAGGLGLEESAVVMSTALNAFKKDNMAASVAADILAGTANASATGVHELAQSLAQVSAVASGSGLSFKDTNIALGVFANNGLMSSDAGTSLKQMLLTLQPITDRQTELFDGLGFTTNGMNNAFYDSAGNIKSMADISGVLRSKLGKMTNQQRQLTLKLMFGTDAIRAANILYEEGAEGINDFEKAMSNVKALDVAKKKMEGAGGAVEQLSGAFETLQISALIPTMPLITRFANSASDLIMKYSPQIIAGMERMVAKASGYLDKHFTNNPAFNNLPNLKAKIAFVFDDVMGNFQAWLDNEGYAKMQMVGNKTVDLLATALKVSAPLIEAASTMGTAIGTGILVGIKNKLLEFTPKDLFKDLGALSAPLPALTVEQFQTPANPYHKSKVPTVPTGVKVPTQSDTTDRSMGIKWSFGAQGKSGGIDNVPYNNFPARLHAGESVLPREEAKRYRGEGGGSSGRGNPFIINMHGTVIREEADIQRIAGQLARLMAT